MDFIITNWNPGPTAGGELNELRYSELDDLMSQFGHEGVYHIVWGSESSLIVEPDRCFAFDGVTSIGEQLFHSTLGSRNPADLAKAMQETELPAAGIYCAINIRRDGRRHIQLATDWLGQYPIYLWREGRRYAVSNNIRMLERLTGAARSILPAVENLVTGGVSECHVHLENTIQIPHGHELHIVSSELRLSPRFAHSLSSLSYEDCLQNLRDSISDHIAASMAQQGEAEPYIICDLTGGSDSRAVLAMLLDKAVDRPIHLRTMGRYPNPDVNVAAYLQKEFELLNGHFPSVAAPRDLAVRFNAALSGGAREAGAVLSPVGFFNLVHFKGCYGEIGGAPGHDFIAEAYKSGAGLPKAIDILFARRRRAGAINFIGEAALELVRATLLQEYQQLIDAGYSTDQLFSERYLRARSRTHFGLLSFVENKSKILPDILANRWLIEAARRLPTRLRSQNKVIYDLIRGGARGELAFMPMANKRWSVDIVEPSDQDKLREMKIIDSKSAELVAGIGPMYASISVPAKMPQNYRALVDVANSTNAVTPQFANLWRHRAISKYMLEAVREDSNIWLYFDRSKLGEELVRPDEGFRSDGIDVNALGIFSSGAAWVNGYDHVGSLKVRNAYKAD